MRVLTVGNMYPPHSLGGYELLWHGGVDALRGRGHQVRVLTTDHRDPAAAALAEEDPGVHRELRWYWRDHAFPRLGARERLRLERHNAHVFDRHVRELRPDVVTWWAMGGMSLSLIERARAVGLPATAVVGDDWLRYGPEVDGWTRLFARRAWAAPLAEAITGVPTGVAWDGVGSWLFMSEAVRRRALAIRPELRAARVAHPGVDLDLFAETPRPAWRWRLLCVGRIDRRKGVDTAIRALPDLPEATTLTVLGGGDEDHLAELRALVDELGLSPRVRFGRRPRHELPRAYAEADALVFPVRWEEPWGLVPLEAMAVGCPVVATGTGGSREYLRDGENCLLFERDRPDALAAAVRRLSGDEALRGRLGEGGLVTARGHPDHAYYEETAVEAERVAAEGRRKDDSWAGPANPSGIGSAPSLRALKHDE
jgi:glycogen(starch) synthase